jgi:hypothetical protein
LCNQHFSKVTDAESLWDFGPKVELEKEPKNSAFVWLLYLVAAMLVIVAIIALVITIIALISISYAAHNPKVVRSNRTPATNKTEKVSRKTGLFCFMTVGYRRRSLFKAAGGAKAWARKTAYAAIEPNRTPATNKTEKVSRTTGLFCFILVWRYRRRSLFRAAGGAKAWARKTALKAEEPMPQPASSGRIKSE